MALETVKSQVSGKVWKIEAKIGDRLKEDDPILIIESMKMEIPALAPAAGTLREILVAEEQDVSEDQALAVIEI